MVDALKGLFQSATNIKDQYLDGLLGQTAGFEFAENTCLNQHTRGAESATYQINDVNQTGSSIVVNTGTGAGNQGDVFTIAGVYRVHPETKVSTGALQQFVLSSAYAGGNGTMQILPAIVISVRQPSAAAGGAVLVLPETVSIDRRRCQGSSRPNA